MAKQTFSYPEWFSNQLELIQEEGRYRTFATLERRLGMLPQAIWHSPQGEKPVTVWCSNDYLGMAQHPNVLAAMEHALHNCGAGAGGTRNIAGTSIYHAQLEAELAQLHSKQRALLFSSGYIANETTLTSLAKNLPDCVILSDEKNHASVINGIRYSGAEKHVFRHNDTIHLASLLQTIAPHRPKIIAFESVYSMDGDVSPIGDIIALAKQYNALTYLDEVHAVGLYNHNGAGMAAHMGVADDIDIIQGTLGKAYGVVGGYIAGDDSLVDYVRSVASGFIFTTAIPPVIAAGALASVQHLRASHTERTLQAEHAQSLRALLTKAGIPHLSTTTHIIPVIVGEAKLCKRITDRLLTQHSIYAQPINYPTVPKGQERMRLTPSPYHTIDYQLALVEALHECFTHVGLLKAAA